MSLLGKMKKKTEELRVQANHPILAMKVGRDVIDAYFEGIVFAAVADDEKIDEAEHDYLSKVGLSLGIPNEEIDEKVNSFVNVDSDGKIARAVDLAKVLQGSGIVATILLCEFSLVWTSHDHDASELDGTRRQLAEWMGLEGFDYDEKFFALFDEVSAKVKADPKAVYALYDYLDDDVIRYLFADIFEIERIFAEKRDAENRAVLPHPLKIVLDDAQRACYLSAVRSAVNETSDNAPTKIQQKGLRHLAIALGVKDANVAADGKEIILTPNSAMRSLAFFRYCDMARLFAMDGRPAFSAAQKRALEEVVTTFLAPDDIAFLKAYGEFIGNGKEADVAEVVRDAQSKIRFPDGFIRYFTPNMKPIVLAGGDASAGVYQIVDGHYRLEHTLFVGAQTTLVIKNAVIDFASGAKIVLNDCAVKISNCGFNSEKGDGKNPMGEPFFSGDSNKEIRFESCQFNGADCRAAICVTGHGTTIISCQFNSLLSCNNNPIIGQRYDSPYTLSCSHSQWNDCNAPEGFFSAKNVNFQICDFVNCSAGTFIRCYGYHAKCHIEACLFDGCSCSSQFWLKDADGWRDTRLGGPYSSFNCNYGSRSDGFSEIISSGFTLDKLHEARAKLVKVNGNES